MSVQAAVPASAVVPASAEPSSGGPVTVTLPTGEKVKVTERDGEPQVDLGAGHGAFGAEVRRVGRKVYVVPFRAMSSLASGALDDEAFEVTGPAEASTAKASGNRTSAGPGTSAATRSGDPVATVDAPVYDVTVKVLDRAGGPAKDAWDISANRVGGGYGQTMSGPPGGDGELTFQLTAGTWIFYSTIHSEKGGRQELVQLLTTGVHLPPAGREAMTVVLDGRTAVRASLDVTGLGRTVTRQSVQGFTWEYDHGNVSSYLYGDDRSDVYVTPVPPVAEPGLTFNQTAVRRQPDAALTLPPGRATTSFDLEMMAPDDRVQGTRAVQVVPIASGESPGKALPAGALALARIGGDGGFPSVEKAVDAATARRATGVVLWSEVDNDWRLTVNAPPALPLLTPEDGAAFAAAVGAGPVRGTLVVDQWNHPVVDLARHFVGTIPSAPSATSPASGLARVRQVFHPQADVAMGRDNRLAGVGASCDVPRFIRFGAARTDFVTPGVPWYETVTRGPLPDRVGGWETVVPRRYQAGREVSQDWGDPVQRPTLVAGDNRMVFRTVGPWFVGRASHWTDGAGHPASPANETVSWRLTSDGGQIGSGQDTVWAEVGPGTHIGQLTLDLTRLPEPGRTPVTAHTVWTFPLHPSDAFGDPDDIDAGEIMPMLSVDPRLPVDSADTLPSGKSVSFDVNGSIVGVPSSRTESVKVWTWADGTADGTADGARTAAGAVTRVDEDTFRVTITVPTAAPGTRAGMRIVATGSHGTAIDQTLDTAFTVR